MTIAIKEEYTRDEVLAICRETLGEWAAPHIERGLIPFPDRMPYNVMLYSRRSVLLGLETIAKLQILCDQLSGQGLKIEIGPPNDPTK